MNEVEISKISSRTLITRTVICPINGQGDDLKPPF